MTADKKEGKPQKILFKKCRDISKRMSANIKETLVALVPALAAVPESDEGRVRDDGAGTEQVRRNVGRRKGVVRELLRSRPI